MAHRQILWVEAWIETTRYSYVLLLQNVEERFQIVDPQKNGAIIEVFDSYDDAQNWLHEDEYDQIEGRYALER
ncbi:MAG: hypothetical protein NVS3B20_09930 [Polyangiales bacterium]